MAVAIEAIPLCPAAMPQVSDEQAVPAWKLELQKKKAAKKAAEPT